MGEKFSLISFLLFVVNPRAFTVVAQPRFPPQNPKLYFLSFWKIPVLASCYIFESVFHVNNSVQFDFALVRDLRKYHFTFFYCFFLCLAMCHGRVFLVSKS